MGWHGWVYTFLNRTILTAYKYVNSWLVYCGKQKKDINLRN